MERVLDAACEVHASDVHVCTDASPVFRVNGMLCDSGLQSTALGSLLEFLSSVIPHEVYTRFLARNEVDGAFTSKHGRWRVHAYHAEHGVRIALRRLPKIVPSPEKLGIPPIVHDFAKLPRGLVLVTGATGSGKTTTAAALIDLVCRTRALHIVTIEDPIEYLFTASVGMVSQREVGKHTSSFAQALRSALREDPDLIFVGEMRDLETIQLALQAAETGHLVISTLHTAGASKAVSRIIDVFPAEQQPLVRSVLAATLEAVVSQELVATPGGRVLVPEVLIGTPSVRALIREGKFHQLEHVMHTSLACGMLTRARSVECLRARGSIPPGQDATGTFSISP